MIDQEREYQTITTKRQLRSSLSEAPRRGVSGTKVVREIQETHPDSRVPERVVRETLSGRTISPHRGVGVDTHGWPEHKRQTTKTKQYGMSWAQDASPLELGRHSESNNPGKSKA